MKKIFLLWVIVTTSHFCVAQNVRWDYIAWTTNTLQGQLIPLMVIPKVPVAIYTGCTVLPCSTRAVTYNSQSSTTPCPSNAQIVYQLSISCSSITDPQGNFGAWFTSGTYQYTITKGGRTYGPYAFTVGSSGGGTGNPAGTVNNVQTNAGSGSFGFDPLFNNNPVLHALTQKMINNIGYAQEAQTTAGSNDGIVNLLSSNGNMAFVDPTYSVTEFQRGVALYRTPFSLVNFYGFISVAPPIAANTWFEDYRNNNAGYYAYNPTAAPVFYNRTLYDRSAPTPFYADFVNWTEQTDIGAGTNGFDPPSGGPTQYEMFLINHVTLGRGIAQPVTIQQTSQGDGDKHTLQITLIAGGGNPDASGEGDTPLRLTMIEDSQIFNATVNGNQPIGTTSFAYNTAFVATSLPGDGEPLILPSLGVTTQATAIAHSPGGQIPGTITTTLTITPDNIGTISTDLNSTAIIPQQAGGGTTTVANIQVNGLSAPLVAGSTSFACVADTLYAENVNVVAAGSFSGGNQLVTLALRHIHQVGASISQGPHSCWFVEAVANRDGGDPHTMRDITRIIGFKDSHTFDYAYTVVGNWANWPNRRFATFGVPGGTLTRNGSGTLVTNPSVCCDFTGAFYNGMPVQVTGTDPTFNGLFGVTEINLGSGNFQLQWSQSGAAGATTSGSLQALVNLLPANQLVLYPGAEVTSPVDPTTHVMGARIQVEPFPVPIPNGIPFEVQRGHVVSELGHFVHSMANSTSPSTPSTGFDITIDRLIPDQYTMWHYNVVPAYEGAIQLAGGTQAPTARFVDMSGGRVWNEYFRLPPPSGNGASIFFISGCPLGNLIQGPCTVANTSYDLWHIENNSNIFIQSWTDATKTMLFNIDNASLYNFNRTGFLYQAGDNANLTYNFQMNYTGGMDANLSNTNLNTIHVLWHLGEIKHTIINPGGNSNFDQTPTQFTMDQPLFIQSSQVCTVANGLCGGGGGGGGVTLINGVAGAFTFSGAVSCSGATCNFTGGGGGAVASVSNSDGTLTVGPTTGAVVASLNLSHANIWLANQTIAGTTGTVGLTLSLPSGTGATQLGFATSGSNAFSLTNWTSGNGLGLPGVFGLLDSTTGFLAWHTNVSDDMCGATNTSLGSVATCLHSLWEISHLGSAFFTLLTVSDTSGVGGGGDFAEGTTAACTATFDTAWADSSTHTLRLCNNGGTSYKITQTIGSGSVALHTAAIASGACDTTSATVTGTLNGDLVDWYPSADISAVTGYIPGVSGGLDVKLFVTSNTLNFKACNWSSASITPGAVTIEYGVSR